MLTSHKQIVVSFEELKMTPEEIAEDQGLDIVAVKAVLMQNSPSFQKQKKKDPKNLGFTESQHEDFLRIIHETALSAELPDGSPDYRTRLKAATYGRDDIKGRREPSIHNAPQFNIFQFNEQMAENRRLAENARRALVESTVDVEAVTT